MTSEAIQRNLESALGHEHAGRKQEAERIYRQILMADPDQPDALHLLGLMALSAGRFQDAIALIRRAVAVNPAAEYLFNLGNAFYSFGNLEEAARCAKQVLAAQPSMAEAHYLLGMAQRALNRLQESAASFKSAVCVRPHWGDAWNALGVVQRALGHLDDALHAYRKAADADSALGAAYSNLGNLQRELNRLPEAEAAYRTALLPGKRLADLTRSEVYNGLGIILAKSARLDEAVDVLQAAIRLNPTGSGAYINLGAALRERGRRGPPGTADQQPEDLNTEVQTDVELAAKVLRRAVELAPLSADAHNNLGIALQELERYDEAIESYHRAVAIKPDSSEAYCNLAALKEIGEIDEALKALRRSIELDPAAASTNSNLLFNLCFHEHSTPALLLEEARVWNDRHAKRLEGRIVQPQNDPSPERKLRIGYVSPDFTTHPVGRFLVPVLDHRDRLGFEVHLFSNVLRPDDGTLWFRQVADRWHDIAGFSDLQAADCIRNQHIDILVDLALHASGNRLPVFAQKPAPVQATFLAYCSTSGMDAMDYLIGDSYLIPPEAEAFVCEKPVRLSTYWCFRPLGGSPDCNALPASSNGHVTFGCFNSFGKVSSTTLKTWCRLLNSVPHSRLIVHSPPGRHRETFLGLLASDGVDPRRLTFAPRVRLADYVRQYHNIDIALDPFPFPGGTTTCDALWMGVPVVSLAGQTTVSRGGLSILSNVGLPELVGRSIEEYIEIAVDLALDLPRLVELRATLRRRMQNSPLMNEKQYVADLEGAYRRMWRTWCGKQS